MQVQVTQITKPNPTKVLHTPGITGVVLREDVSPLLPSACQGVCQPHPLPGQQAVGGDQGEQRGVEDTVGGLSHQQPTAQQVEIIQRCQEAWAERGDKCMAG